MPVHYTIFKLLPETGERVIIHQRVPEQMVEWLCKICDLEMRDADRKKGFVIMKESVGRPVEREVLAKAS